MANPASKRRTALAGLVQGLQLPEVPRGSPTELSVAVLDPLPGQPRRSMNAEAMQELQASVRANGVLTPLLVRPVGEGRYQIVAGERRWRAAQAAGLSSVPVTVRELGDDEARRYALIENVQREDLNPIDRVDATAQLVAAVLDVPADQLPARLAQLRKHPDAPGHTEQTAKLDALFTELGGTWRSFERNQLPVLRFPPDILEAVRSGLEYTKGAVVAQERDPERRKALLREALEGASVEALRRALHQDRAPLSEQQAQIKRVARLVGDWRRLERLPERNRQRALRLIADLARLLED